MLNYCWVLFLLVIPAFAVCQKAEKAHQLGLEGIALVDKGLYSDGIKLLAKARNLNPAEFDYPFEIGRAYMLARKSVKAEKFLFPLQYHKSVTPEFYVLLGACYDSINKPKREEETYRYGIEKFPNAGLLYFQLAGYYISRDSIAEGLSVCELGLEHDPSFADNYFLASRIMDVKGDALWAWWYGEVFLNLSSNLVMKRGLVKQVAANALEVCSKDWQPDADKLSQTVSLSTKACENQSDTTLLARQILIRQCFAKNYPGQDAFTTMLREMEQKNMLSLYVATLFSEVDKNGFLTLASENGPALERFTHWFYWNSLNINTPFTRNTISIP